MKRIAAWVAVCLAAFAGTASAQTLDRIADAKTVRIGFLADQAPFAAAGPGGAPAGYAIDICGVVVQAIVRRVPDVKPAYVAVSLAEAFDAVAAGRIDMLCGAVTANLARRQSVDFSEPFFMDGASALLGSHAPRILHELSFGDREISPPRSPELRPYETLRVGVRAGTTTETALRNAIARGGFRAEVLGVENHADGLAALESRRIDAYFADRALLFSLLGRARDPSSLVVGTRLFTREPYAIAIARGDSEFRLLIDGALSEFYATPAFGALLTRYFGAAAEAMRAQVVDLSVPE